MLEQNENWKMKTLLLGTLVGALIGLGTGYLLTRTAEENGNRPEITTGDAIKASLGIIGVVRGIVALGDRK
jgi:gas vesicle protein